MILSMIDWNAKNLMLQREDTVISYHSHKPLKPIKLVCIDLTAMVSLEVWSQKYLDVYFCSLFMAIASIVQSNTITNLQMSKDICRMQSSDYSSADTLIDQLGTYICFPTEHPVSQK